MTDERFIILAEKYTDTVFRVAYSFLKSRTDAQDVTQDTLLKLYQAPEDSFHSDEHVRNWLIRVAANGCKSLLRSPWRRTEPLDACTAAIGLPSDEHQDLFRAVMALPAKYRVVIHLYYYEGYSTDEIARLLDIPSTTVRTRMARARARLKNDLSEAYGL